MTRDDLAEKYLATLPYTLYPVQEDALLAWFSSEQGVMVCAPTGTGKTLIAEAAVFEALHTGKRMYYTTPLIALTDQKFRDLQKKVIEWGFSPNDVGLVTGNHRVNPDARILVVVAEILFNRLLHPDQTPFHDVQSVVMDEFHNFNDPERGIVWEFSLGLLPRNVRLLLLSATVGNAVQFENWMEHEHQHRLELVQSDERKVPLVFQWVGDKTLLEQLQWMSLGGDDQRMTPALVFCFNRDECWRIAEEVKGKELISAEARSRLVAELGKHDWTQGAGPRLKQLLMRGVGIHHAGILPRYRRVVEFLFQQKLLAIATCTETLSAGINLPARSVVLPSLMKGPMGKQKMIDSGSAHQIFGRAGRPQYDVQGYVFVMAHEDDVKIARWQEKFDRLPADSKDPKILAEKKSLKKKQPKRSPLLQYWNEAQFLKLKNASAGSLESQGLVPWRLLAYMLEASADVETLRNLVQKRLMYGRKRDRAQHDLERQLATLWSGGYVQLEPEPPAEWFPQMPRPNDEPEPLPQPVVVAPSPAPEKPVRPAFGAGIFDDEPEPEPLPTPEPVPEPVSEPIPEPPQPAKDTSPYVFLNGIAYLKSELPQEPEEKPAYFPTRAKPTPALARVASLRSIHPVYGDFLLRYFPLMDRNERIQALESVLELPSSLGPSIRVPFQDELPRGSFAINYLDVRLMELGLALPEELIQQTPEERRKRREAMLEPIYTITFAEKLQRLFQHHFPLVSDAKIWPCWVAGDLLRFHGKFNTYITSKGLQKQEGMIFRHLLRLVLLLNEFVEQQPDEAWAADLREVGEILTLTCQAADPTGTLEYLAVG
ncbi:MAG: DEAD/DEAH box helicase [Planctomycetia bacterium]|nr:DEAD/DEAH box helicase [Planctomycetia bacterium]